jgi:glycosyltransferase involved in cell wall biosynthesis
MLALIERLARHHEIDVLSFGDGSRDDDDTRALEAAGARRVLLMPRRPDRRPDWLGLRPAVMTDYHDPMMARAVAGMANEYDVLQVEYSLMAAYAPKGPRGPGRPGPRTVWTVHELLCARLRRELDLRHGPVRALLAYRYLQMLRWELSLAARFDHVLAIADGEACEMRARGVTVPISASPMGVDTREFRPTPAEAEEPGLVLFVGFFGHAPNTDAALWLVHDILPQVRAATPGAHVALVGRDPTPAITALARPGTVEVTGFVPDLRPWLARAQAVVVPVREGGGVRGKVLEAWAAARPLVSTPLGVSGLAARDGDNALLAPDAAGIAAHVVRLLGDAELRRRLGAGGRETVEAGYDWDAIATAHDELYAALLARRAA